MSNEETKQDGKTKKKKSVIKNPIVIAAIIAAVAGIIVALINAYSVKAIEVFLVDKETKQGISGDVFVDAEKNGIRSVPDRPAVIKVKRGDQYIKAESGGYKTELAPIARIARTLTIEMEMTAVAAAVEERPMSFVGQRPWSDEITVRPGSSANEVIVSGVVSDAAGFSISGLPSAMRGATLVLHFANTGASRFSRNRMIKIEYNRNDILLPPANAAMANSEYLANEDTPPDNGVEFPIPDNFDGRLNFIFYQAELDNLIITAFYK